MAQFRRGCFPVFVDQEAASPAAERGEGNEKEEPPVPPAIKDIGRHDNEKVLPSYFPVEYKPVKQERYRQEDGEFQGVEKHQGCLL